MPKGLPYSLANIQTAEANTIAAAVSAASATTLVQSATAIDDATLVLDTAETVTTGASPVALDLVSYKATVTTGGTAGGEDLTIGDGTGAVIGQRKLVTLGTRTDASDVVSLDHANIVNASGTQTTNCDLDAAGEYVLLEWNGAKWQIVYTNGTVAT